MDRPAPLVPADVDLRDFPHMPLHVRRLRDSKFAASVSGDGFAAGVLLWAAAWHQLPAGSLPNDDIELSQLAGYGRALREWRKVRPEALYHWIECLDGRLYHPIVAEIVLDSWAVKLHRMHDRLYERVRKANKNRAEGGLQALHFPAYDAWLSAGRPDPFRVYDPTSSAGIPPENRLDPAVEVKGSGSEGMLVPEVPRASPDPPPVDNFPTSGRKKLNGEQRRDEQAWMRSDTQAAEAGARFGVTRRKNEVLPDFVDRIVQAMQSAKNSPRRRGTH